MDRRSIIIVILCVIAIGLNFYYSGQNQKLKQEQEAARQAQQVQTSQAQTTAMPDAAQPGLVVPPPPVNPDVKTWDIIVNRDVDGVSTPVSKYTFTNLGGAIRSVEMMGHAVDSQKVPDINVAINKSTETRGIGNLVFGMSAAADPVFDNTVYKRVDEGKDPSRVSLVGRTSSGLAVLKEYTLEHFKDKDGKQLAGSDYMVHLKITIENSTDRAIRIPDMGLFAGAGYPVAQSERPEAFTNFFYMHDGDFEQNSPGHFKGGWFSNAKARELVSEDNITYAGVMSQYYVTAVIPMEGSRGNSVFAKSQDFHLVDEGNAQVPGVVLALGTPVIDLQPGQQQALEYTIYTGPKLNQVLRDLPHDYQLQEVMAYGSFTFLSAPMNWLLNLFHGWFFNWGIAIICMTIVVRILIWPLHKKSYMSMKRMSLVQPKLQELKEKYGNDQQKMSAKMMALYKQYGINPLSGCLPMLIQIPIFFAFYRVLQYSAELRGQPFFLWIKDLSLPDTFFEVPFIGYMIPINILPLIMAVTMILQMKMTPQAGDKTQQRIMALMPLVFFAFCYNFASALALYWTTQNIISMGQTLLIRRLPQPELTKTGKNKKPGFFQRLMEQQRAVLEQQQQMAKKAKGGNMRNVTPRKKK